MPNPQRNQDNHDNHSRQGQPDDAYQRKGNGAMNWRDILSQMSPPWLIDSILPADAISMIYGYSGAGKSFWALDMALCVASGRDWNGHAVRQGDVLYIAGEGVHGFGPRIRAWMAKHRCEPGRFYMYRWPVHLWRSHDSVRRFIYDVNEMAITPSLIVIDTLSTALGGADENDNGQIREILDSLDDVRCRWDAAVLLIHHTGAMNEPKRKSVSRRKAIAAAQAGATTDATETAETFASRFPPAIAQRYKRARGAQALQDGVSMHARLVGDGATYAELICTKQRDAEAFAPITRTLYRMELQGGDTSLTLADAYATGPRDASKVRISWEAISAVLAAATGPLTPKEIADALGLGPSGRKSVGMQLARHKDDVQQPPDSSGYILTRGHRASAGITRDAPRLVA